MQSKFLSTLSARGFIHQCTNIQGLDQSLMQNDSITAYVGFDCTAPSLHIGNLIQIMMLRSFQQHGHRPIVLLGSATTRIGDPSGKDKQRQALNEDVIQKNKDGIQSIFRKFLSFEGKNKAIIVDNYDWLGEISYLDFLSKYGRHFSINKMLTFDSIKSRLDRQSHLSFLEFCYMTLQAYDFFELYQRHGCTLQFGGSDQWGNIVGGVEVARKLAGIDIFGLTSPLLVNSQGKKMGKTADGAIWLDEKMFSAYDYWQFWRNTSDEDVIRFLKLFTELSLDDITKLKQTDNINDVKVVLANEATKLIHGAKTALSAEQTATATFNRRTTGELLPTIQIKKDELESTPIFKLILLAGLCQSSSQARRLVQGKGIRVNNKVVELEFATLSLEDFHEKKAKLSVGKKKHALIELQQEN